MQGWSELDKFLLKIKLGNEYLPQAYIGDVFHYTSPNGFDSILFSHESIKLWANRYDCLNDMSEGTIAQKIFEVVCDEMLENEEMSSEFYDVVKGCRKNKTTLFHVPEDGRWKPSRDEWESFICSFSRNNDSLAMWNYYSKGSKYEGYNIGFQSESLKRNLENTFNSLKVNFSVCPIIYKKSEQKELIASFLKNLENHYEKGEETSVRYIVCDYLTKWSLIFKSEYFEHEQEVRVIVDVEKKKKHGVIQERPLKINYRHNHGYIIPYIELEFDKDTLASVSIGPLQCTDKQKEVQKSIMEERLESAGYDFITVKYSDIPVRF